MRPLALALLLILIGLAPLLFPATALVGTVTDQDGQPLPGARVRLAGTPHATMADPFGRYHFPPRSGQLTASMQGFFIAGLAPGSRDFRLAPLPAQDHADYAWVDPTPSPADPGRCGNCHRQTQREWAVGAHAHSVTGEHFQRTYARLLRDKPDGAGVCSACHAPTVRDDDPALFDLRQVKGIDRRGVHCDYCHKIQGLGEGEIGLTHGRFLLQLLRPREGQLFFGPLDDVARGEDSWSPFYKDSRYCAACHEGVVFGFHVYTTYSEWLASPARRAGVQCQGCHMKPTGAMRNTAPGRGGLDRDPHTLSNHRFWDGSQEDMLRRCLSLTVQTRRHPDGVASRVRLLAQGVGHQVPTGFVDRQLVLLVEGRDARGDITPALAGPRYQDRPGVLFARTLRDERGEENVPFWRALPEVLDTRLVPGQPVVTTHEFPIETRQLRIRLVHRRPGREIVVVDRVLTVE